MYSAETEAALQAQSSHRDDADGEAQLTRPATRHSAKPCDYSKPLVLGQTLIVCFRLAYDAGGGMRSLAIPADIPRIDASAHRVCQLDQWYGPEYQLCKLIMPSSPLDGDPHAIQPPRGIGLLTKLRRQ